MRYLSQLARETVARVAPSRRPSWLHDLRTLVESSEFVPGVMPPALAQPSVSSAGDAPALSSTRPMMHRRADDSRDAEIAPRRTGRHERTEATELQAPVARAYKEVTQHVRDDARPAELIEAASRGSSEPGLQIPTPKTNEMKTIGDVLAEIARRQHELETAPPATRTSVGLTAPVSFPSERPGDVRHASAEEINVHIGSITVQVDPGPAAAAPMPAAPMRRAIAPVRTTSNEFSRSFLDR